jgi:hypothetical protein
MRARRREVVMTTRARIGLWLKMFAPARVDRMARAALARPGEAKKRSLDSNRPEHR